MGTKKHVYRVTTIENAECCYQVEADTIQEAQERFHELGMELWSEQLNEVVVVNIEHLHTLTTE